MIVAVRDDVLVAFGIDPHMCASAQKRQKGECSESAHGINGITHKAPITYRARLRAIPKKDDAGLPSQSCAPGAGYVAVDVGHSLFSLTGKCGASSIKKTQRSFSKC